MASTSINISLSEQLKEKIQQRISDGLFSNPSDYIRHLVRADIEQQNEKAELTRLIQEGIDSGFSDKNIDQIFADIKKGIRQKA